MSILPAYSALILGLLLALVVRARRIGALSRSETAALLGLGAAILAWLGLVVAMGRQGTHLALMRQVPLLWQAPVVPTIAITGMLLIRPLRTGLWVLARATPDHWLVALQALRIGAIGGVLKGLSGDIASAYVFWIGIPDMLFGLSALVLVPVVRAGRIGPRALAAWNIAGFALVVGPTFAFTGYWMAEPGFRFIFDFPMVLAPAFVVSLLTSLNLLHAWAGWRGGQVCAGGTLGPRAAAQ